MSQRFSQKLAPRTQALQGFPLIEVMAMLACIGILASIAIQKFLAY